MNPCIPSSLPELLLDEIECGLIVCDMNRSICFVNQTAQRELASSRVLLRQGSELRSAPAAGGGLEGAVAQAAQGGKRQLLSLGSGVDRLLVSVVPLRAGTERPRVLLVLRQRQACSELGLEMLAGFHGLTLTERRVMAALLRRCSPREIAEQHGVALSTVRTQIHSIRAKIGTRSIDELLLRAAEVPPVASALRFSMPSFALPVAA